MKKLTITINTENAAFDELEEEVAWILNEIKANFQCQGIKTYKVFDSNGKNVGDVTIE